MLYLGLSGGLNRIHENPFELSRAFTHDGAAVLVEDGRVVAAIEEERLNRIKHSNKFPVRAMRFCLESRGARGQDVDRFVFYATEAYCNTLLSRIYLSQRHLKKHLTARLILRGLLEQELGCEIDPARIMFVRHHLAHAVSAFDLSGFDRSLVLAIDGYGDFLSGLMAVGDERSLREIETYPQRKSLGLLYLDVIQFLGYGPFDEYKVMGLAPYGNPSTYRSVLRSFYDLFPNGGYDVYLDQIAPVLLGCIEIRKKGEPFSQQHKDLAASLQETLEEIVMHVLQYHRDATGMRNLCLAGGVAHNCTMNGKLLYSRLFAQMFVQPAAHDAGCALGAALLASHADGRYASRARMSHVYWGTGIGDKSRVESELERWQRFLELKESRDVTRDTACLLAEGAVIGWVQGRSEFGPRALGNRSILADPRPADNKERINAMIKKREEYRPFAPSVLEEDVCEWFDVPENSRSFPFMVFVVPLRPDKRHVLGATTHVDGTARIHTVAQETNPLYWRLIRAFKDITGVPVLLNTSFNNNVEPIVDSIEDAIVSFLTTGLDYLVVGDFIASKRIPTQEDWLSLELTLPLYSTVHRNKSYVDGASLAVSSEIRTSYDGRIRHRLSNELCDLLMGLERVDTIGRLFEAKWIDKNRTPALVAELREIWAQRLVTLRPCARGPQSYGKAA